MSDEAKAMIDGHRRAQEAFAAVLANVGRGQLDGPTPCSDWTVRALVGHVVGGNRHVAGEEPAPLPASPEDLAAAHRASADAAQGVFAAPDGLSRMYDVPFGTVPGSVCVRLRTTDVLVHAWDLARATGQSTDLDPEVAEAMLVFSHQLIRPELRGSGRPFAEEQRCGDDASPADRLATFLGRSATQT